MQTSVGPTARCPHQEMLPPARQEPGPVCALLEELWVPWPQTGTSQNMWAWLKGARTRHTVSAICSLSVSFYLNGGQVFFPPFCLFLVVACCLLCFCLLFLNSRSLYVALFFLFPALPCNTDCRCMLIHPFPSLFRPCFISFLVL